MRVHHLNCATMCPIGGRLVNGTGSVFSAARMVCHCLLIESEHGLVLVDTGLGTADVADPDRRLGKLFSLATRPRLDPEETALHQVQKLGFRASDVRHVIPTHLDLDHAGGLPDFPDATVHLFADEHRAAMERTTRHERMRYRRVHFAHGPRWKTYCPAGEPWFGFDCVRDLEGVGPDVLLVPTIGHTRGHVAVAVRYEGSWLLHAGDAYFHHGEMDPVQPRATPLLGFFQRYIAVDDRMRRHNQARLRELARDRASEVKVFCAHDPTELERMSGEAVRDPDRTFPGGVRTHGSAERESA